MVAGELRQTGKTYQCLLLTPDDLHPLHATFRDKENISPKMHHFRVELDDFFSADIVVFIDGDNLHWMKLKWARLKS